MGALSDEVLVEIAAYFRVLAEPMRLKILQVLMEGEQSVGEVIAETGGNQANISKHLHILWQAGILQRRTVGTSVRYMVVDPVVFEICQVVYDYLVRQMAVKSNLRASLLPMSK
ncbi:ArsR/SmtB family transcription factor [Anthocerotibacter panamensis]|uniref:ArsR/SmtB family transcription factor n=1 Tax=Anthocerotibacter panamensis TaxID=2857077 RepID=UPI001C40418D|nr:metalloregulator ArsR/SmtB family transcription factor [Anthocerotibacter panamensis]